MKNANGQTIQVENLTHMTYNLHATPQQPNVWRVQDIRTGKVVFGVATYRPGQYQYKNWFGPFYGTASVYKSETAARACARRMFGYSKIGNARFLVEGVRSPYKCL
jgi:hypothetical protein